MLGIMSRTRICTDLLVRSVTRLGFCVARLYRRNEDWLRDSADRRCVTAYDDRISGFVGGELEFVAERNYENALRLLWKAVVQPSYLGIYDASKHEQYAYRVEDISVETRDFVEWASSQTIRDEFRANFSPEERAAIIGIMSLIAHGEAYALYISSTVLPFVTGRGGKLALSRQVMEEAKHFIVLQALMRKLANGSKLLHTSARIFLEKVARAKPYNRLFGLNILMESCALQLFGEFSEYPGFGQLLKKFHLEEARHCAFPKNYAKLGLVPDHIKNSRWNRLCRSQILLTAIPIVFDYRPYFAALGIDAFEFFGKALSKALRLAELSDLPLFLTRKEHLALTNLTMNAYLKVVEPEQCKGFKDYCLVEQDSSSAQLQAPKGEVFLKRRFYLDVIESINRMKPQRLSNRSTQLTSPG